ncbi:PulJ/GspJ family protein [Flagellimonas algicola]|uniref:Type II secretion system protein n=1 Tax=Flagellimonas algicola TaxID=2583815 RepID=A0ABY2WM95_9FLAO|nr:type II secretion system protein [Allomuricauda algicola]TMU55651.1 type II secretion system protein [Allomuricauda algicola]
MNLENSKIKAFTLTEMLVVLLITSIVISLGFSVLRLVQQQMYTIGGIYESNTEANLLRQSLWVDFNRHDGVWYDEQRNELVFANELKNTVYQWQQDYVVKERDTFFLKTHEATYYFNGLPTQSSEVDALDFSVGNEGKKQRIVVYKTNAATTYLNQ